MFVDDAHFLLKEKQALEELFAQVEEYRGTLVFLLAGNDKTMRNLLGRDSKNIRSLFPYVLALPDYTDDELRKLLAACIAKKFSGKMRVREAQRDCICESRQEDWDDCVVHHSSEMQKTWRTWLPKFGGANQ